MTIRERTIVDRLPGHAQTKTTLVREWVCPECDYFEEVGDVAD